MRKNGDVLMSEPTAFQAMRQRKAEETKKADERAERIRAEREREESELYQKIQKALVPYENCTLTDDYGTKRRVSVKFNAKDNRANVYFDGYCFLTFLPERMWSSCHCEGPCEHTGNTWLIMRVVQHQNRSGYEDYHCYFPCSQHELEDENAFAEAMNKMLTEFRYAAWVKL